MRGADVLSIGIPTYKRPALLERALDSAVRQRTSRPYQILVVDNDAEGEHAAAIDALLRTYASPRLRYVRNPANLGMFGNWNRCLSLAEARYVTVLSDDDWLAPDFVHHMARLMERRPGGVLYACVPRVVDERRRGAFVNKVLSACREASRLLLLPREWKARPLNFLLGNYFAGGTGVIVDRDAALAAGGFDERWYPVADWALWERLSTRGSCWVLERPMAYYRVSQNQSLDPATIQRHIRRCRELREHLTASRPEYASSLIRLLASVCSRADARSPYAPDYGGGGSWMGDLAAAIFARLLRLWCIRAGGGRP